MGNVVEVSKQQALSYCLDMLDQIAEMLATHADELPLATRLNELSKESRQRLNLVRSGSDAQPSGDG